VVRKIKLSSFERSREKNSSLTGFFTLFISLPSSLDSLICEIIEVSFGSSDAQYSSRLVVHVNEYVSGASGGTAVTASSSSGRILGANTASVIVFRTGDYLIIEKIYRRA